MANFFARTRPTTAWAASTAYSLGDRRIPTSATVNRGVHFEVTTAGTSGGAEPAWNATVGGTTSDGTVTWTTRGSSANWAASAAYNAGDRVISVNNSPTGAQPCVFECTTAGTSNTTEPSWTTTVGNTTTDNTVTWTTRAATTWDNAHARIDRMDQVNAQTRPTAGDTIYVSKTYNQSLAAAWAWDNAGGTRLNPIRIICVDDTGDPSSPSTLATTGAITTTGNNSITWGTTHTYIYGLIMSSGSSTGVASIIFGISTSSYVVEDCTLKLLGTSASSVIQMSGGTSGGFTKFINTTVQFSNVSQGISFGAAGTQEWVKGSVVLGTVPTNLFKSICNGVFVGHALDLSNVNTAILDLDGSTNIPGTFDLYGCKLHASAALTSGASLGSGGVVRLINCDSGATNTNLYYDSGLGPLTEELTVIRTGGANDGATGFAWKIVSIATLPSFLYPFISLPISVWNNTTGSAKTATVEIIHDSVTALTDAQVWLEIEYLGSSAAPQYTVDDDRAANIFSTPVDQPSSSVTWTTTGLTNPNKQKLEVTFTPQLKGPLLARVYLAVPSKTIYVDPVITLT